MGKERMPILMTLPEVARRWKVSVKSIRRFIDAKHLGVIRIGKSLRVSEAEVVRFERRNSA
jgi:excisionase family DNA binding protein